MICRSKRYVKPRFFVSAAALALAACNANADQHPAPPPVAVDTTRVHRQTMATYENLDGAVVPYLQSSVSTQQSGTIVRVYANEGDRVRAGETLAKIDDSPLQAQLVQQRGTASQAQARLGQQAQSAYVAAQQTLKIDTEKIAQANAALAKRVVSCSTRRCNGRSSPRIVEPSRRRPANCSSPKRRSGRRRSPRPSTASSRSVCSIPAPMPVPISRSLRSRRSIRSTSPLMPRMKISPTSRRERSSRSPPPRIPGGATTRMS